MSGYYELKNAAGGQFMFNLKADNHETILTSETYVSKPNAKEGIASVQKHSPQDANYQRKTATDGSFFFTLHSTNGQVIGKSEMYTSSSGRDNGIASCKKNGPTTDIRDKTT